MNTISIGIVGSSGRTGEFGYRGSAFFEKMVAAVREKIDGFNIQSDANNAITYVSGGSTWADHVAVALFLKDRETTERQLLLCLPDKFSLGKFVGKTRDGARLNELHALFSKQIGEDTLGQIADAFANDRADSVVCKTFHERNSEIAKSCNILIALTFGNPAKGGTGDTWRKFHGEKHHIDLESLV